ncbi:MAG: pentapeptide repeat-containing protein [Saprospiraceae bacterium]|nr:pentapeptide repeat-containing protein [Saprospiraceae bacterium]
MASKISKFIVFLGTISFCWVLGYINIFDIKFGFDLLILFLVCICFFIFSILNEGWTIKYKIIIIGVLGYFVRFKYFISLVLICFIICILNYVLVINQLSKVQVELDDLRSKEISKLQFEKTNFILKLVQDINSINESNYSIFDTEPMWNRVIVLSTSLKMYKDIYRNVEQFRVGNIVRGHLLKALFKVKKSSIYFKFIINNVGFYGINLANSDLNSLNLNGIDLRYSYLNNSNMECINLDYSDLRGAELVGVNLNHSSLVGANLISANLEKISIIDGNLRNVKLDSAYLTYAIVRNSNLINSSFIQANIDNSDFMESDLSNCLFMSTSFNNTNFRGANLYKIDIYFSSLGNALFDSVIVYNYILEQLWDKSNVGIDTLLNKYQIKCDFGTLNDSILCRFIPKFI